MASIQTSCRKKYFPRRLISAKEVLKLLNEENQRDKLSEGLHQANHFDEIDLKVPMTRFFFYFLVDSCLK